MNGILSNVVALAAAMAANLALYGTCSSFMLGLKTAAAFVFVSMILSLTGLSKEEEKP